MITTNLVLKWFTNQNLVTREILTKLATKETTKTGKGIAGYNGVSGRTRKLTPKEVDSQRQFVGKWNA